MNAEWLAELQARAELDLEALREKLQQIEVGIDYLGVTLPEFRVPEPVASDLEPPALVSSDMSLLDAIRVLRERKRYAGAAE